MSDLVAVEVLIRGRVQGVCFRAWTQEQAARCGLSGWVRNNPDGTVSALFVGGRAVVDEMVGTCHEGPLAARVDGIEQTAVDPPPEARGFRILR
jgi:acylphosphatase